MFTEDSQVLTRWSDNLYWGENGIVNRLLALCMEGIPQDKGLERDKKSFLVNIADCCINAFAVKIHGLHPVLKVSNFLQHKPLE